MSNTTPDSEELSGVINEAVMAEVFSQDSVDKQSKKILEYRLASAAVPNIIPVVRSMEATLTDINKLLDSISIAQIRAQKTLGVDAKMLNVKLAKNWAITTGKIQALANGKVTLDSNDVILLVADILGG